MGYRTVESRAEFEATVRFGVTPESLHLEFKAAYRWTDEKLALKQEHAIEVCRDIAQFANADGGVLLVGVSEKATGDGRKVADTIVPVQEPDRFVQWVEQAIRNNLAPATLSRTIRAIETASGPVVAINVPPHIHIVALWPQADRRGIEYVYRTNHGKGWLNPDEVEEHLMDGSRAVRLAAKRVFEKMGNEHRQIDLVPPVSVRTQVFASNRLFEQLGRDREARPLLAGVGEDHLVIAVYPTGTHLHVPFALVRSIWMTADMRPAISMSARIVREESKESTGYYLDSL